jgi:tetratricopeptide (TPR) repeat protein
LIEKLEKNEEAIEYLDKALAMNPEKLSFDSFLNIGMVSILFIGFIDALGVIHQKLKQYDLAIENLLKATEINPNESVAWLNLGHIMLIQGDQIKAKVFSIYSSSILTVRNIF